MTTRFTPILVLALTVIAIRADDSAAQAPRSVSAAAVTADSAVAPSSTERGVDALQRNEVREQDDFAAMQRYRPSYPFWRHVFTIPDGAILFGSADDGRLLATFPAKGDWGTAGAWADEALASTIADRDLPADLTKRRDLVADLISTSVGPLVQNPSRGLFVAPNARRYGAFLDEWGAIYERFGVPRLLGLAQALVESGFSGRVKSEARAIGLCQWLQGNWRRLQRLAPYPIEAENQTTQAAYCAAYLTILATRYGSFIPALSEHHAGGANVGRILINGERLGGDSVPAQYFLGSEFARDLRVAAPGRFSDVYGTYGPRSFLYSEMIFGNVATVASLAADVPQKPIFGTRVTRPLSLKTLAAKTGVSADVLQTYNPALVSRVPARAVVYLPARVNGLGTDVTFWRRPATAAYASALDRFVAIGVSREEWDSATFDAVLDRFRREFASTRTEEGAVMSTMLAYVLEDRRTNREREILNEFRSSPHILDLFNEAQLERAIYRQASTAIAVTTP